MDERADIFMASLGVETYLVGGAVRNEILGMPRKDSDYMVRGVELKPLGLMLAQSLSSWPKADVRPLTLRDGRQAGWRVSARGLGCIEVVLPRTERPRDPLPGENTHRAFDIVVDPDLDLEEDAKRRDFTWNALYKIIWHPENLHTQVTGPDGVAYVDIIDPLASGLEDLWHKRVQVTHADSFRDDPLRTLRALRFVSTLGYDLAGPTKWLMEKHASAVTGLSAKGFASGTVYEELCKILMGENVREALRAARDTGVLAQLIPEIKAMLGHDPMSPYHDLSTDEHTFAALHTAAAVDAPLRVRLALLFHDTGKPAVQWFDEHGVAHFYARKGIQVNKPGEGAINDDHENVSERVWRDVAARLNVPTRTVEDVALLIRDHMVSLSGKFKASKVRQMRVKYGDAMLHDLLLHRACDVSAKTRANKQHLERIAMMEASRNEALVACVPATIKDLKVSGHDAMEVGLRGREIGDKLRGILHEVASQPNEALLSREWQLGQLHA